MKASIFPVVLFVAAAPAQQPIRLSVDLTEAARKLVHAEMRMPVTSGPLTLVYPRWLPGEHGPTGTVDNLAGLFFTGNGQSIAWKRDLVDQFAFHLTIPAGVTELDIKLDYLNTAPPSGFSNGASTTPAIAVLSWNNVVLYPANSDASKVMFAPSITLPAGWKFASALKGAPSGFETVSLETLIDSPLLTGKYFREIPLAPDVKPAHYLDIAADGPEDLAISQAHIDEFSNLVRQADLLYKSHHYRDYHFLLTVSDQFSAFGLEHHESSDNREGSNYVVDDSAFVKDADLLPHEFTHSWNGKYRRPAGLATKNYQDPQTGELLWVYEGLTQYLGDVLSARSGLWSPAQFMDHLAFTAATLDNRPGRTWRDLEDTAIDAQVLYYAQSGYDNWRRNTDYYDEGILLWLDVDTTIREKSGGKKSLNDFIAAFHGLGGNTLPKVIPYTFQDVVSALNAVQPYDWAAFLNQRLKSHGPGAPLEGIARGGYRLTYTAKPSDWVTLTESSGSANLWFSIGLIVSKDGGIVDVLKGSAADKAGLGPGMKIFAVDGRKYAGPLLHTAVTDAVNGPLVELIVENDGFYSTVKLDYRGGERFPALERTSGEDLIAPIMVPLVK